MTSRYALVILALASACLNAPLRGSELRISIERDGKQLELAGTNGDGVLLAGPARDAVRSQDTWSLQDDLQTHAALVRWAPVYAIRRADERTAQLTPGKPWRAKVEVRHAPKAKGDLPKDLAPLLADWPEGLPAGGVAVAVWLVGGAVTETVPVPLPATGSESFGFAAEFALTEEQAAAGQAALLLWRDGDFVAPAAQFRDGATQQAFLATLRDDPAALDRSLGEGAKPEDRSRDGYSLIHYASEAGATECVKLLLKRKAALGNLDDGHRWKPVHHAAAKGRLRAVNTLLAGRAKADAGAGGAGYPLTLAVQGGHIGVVDALLAKGADASGHTTINTPLQLAIDDGFADIAERLLVGKATYDFKAPAAGRGLLVAALRGHNSLVRWFLSHGVDANVDFRGATALAAAARSGDPESARALLEAGARVDAATEQGSTPLMAAARAGNVGYARVLLEAGADPTRHTDTGATALHLAAQGNATELVELLLERGADPNSTTRSGYSPLEVALSAGSADSARALAARGAVINLGHPASESLLASAVRLDIAEVIEAALREGWPADSNFAGTWPAARVAEIFRSRKCLDLLLAAGAPPPDSSQPIPVASAKELDAPIKLVRPPTVMEPRDSDEVFPATTVPVSLLIDAEGRPLFPAIIQALDPRLGPAALASAATFRFQPGRRNGQPVAVRIQVPVVFPASSERIHELEGLGAPPLLVFRTAPVYPFDLKRREITGRVEIGFIVTASGKVEGMMVLSATHREFAEAAMAAIGQWRFKPGMIDGAAVNTRMRQPMAFTLDE